MKTVVRIMLVEDNPRYRKALALAVADEPDMELVGQYGTAEIALCRLRTASHAEPPQLILLDLRLPGASGLDALPDLRAAVPEAKIIVLTQSDAEADVLRAISLGASGYLLKSSTVRQIVEGIRTVIGGGATLDPRLARFIVDTLRTRLPTYEADQVLTDRQLEILALLGEGLVKKEIANRLRITYATVDEHISHIYKRLGVHNAPAAVNRAHRLGLFKSVERKV